MGRETSSKVGVQVGIISLQGNLATAFQMMNAGILWLRNFTFKIWHHRLTGMWGCTELLTAVKETTEMPIIRGIAKYMMSFCDTMYLWSRWGSLPWTNGHKWFPSYVVKWKKNKKQKTEARTLLYLQQHATLCHIFIDLGLLIIILVIQCVWNVLFLYNRRKYDEYWDLTKLYGYPREQNLPPQIVSLWHEDFFRMVAF